MKAILVKEPGGVEQLEMGTFETPEPGVEEILVRVKATALNRADLLQRQGKYPPPKGASPLLGLEIAGIVERVGEGCTRYRPGDEVFGLLPGGGYAEYVTMPELMALPKPQNLSFEEAAAVPEVFLTAFQALYQIAGMMEGDRVLIHAGASGVGTAAIQLVKEAGATALITASAPKLDFCRSLGADVALDRAGDWAQGVLDATGGVDIIIDFIGAAYWEPNVKALARDGRIVILATMGGVIVDTMDIRPLFARRAQVTFSSLRTRSKEYQIALTQDFASHCMGLFERGELKPVIDRIYDWSEVAAAHERMAANENLGKIVLRVS